ncbi:TatD family nuclease-associated radical SAM protein [Acidaminobacterium chupaoyuni]
MNTIAYGYGDKLYLNITNRCHLDCAFCIRKQKNGLGDAESLWLEKEPDRHDIVAQVLARDLGAYQEIVFCGYGEPTERLDDLLYIARELKKQPGCPPLRLDTNGLASRLYTYDTTPEIAERFDAVSISLNAPTAQEYAALCPSQWGEEAFFAMLEFAKNMRQHCRQTSFTVVDFIGEEAVERARQLAQMLEIPLRVRHYQSGEKKEPQGEEKGTM